LRVLGVEAECCQRVGHTLIIAGLEGDTVVARTR
jgi:hypothetical protein